MKAPYNNPQSLLRGMSTFEILIAFALITLAMTAAITVLFGAQTTGSDAQTNIEAISKAEALLEQERALARQDFSSVQSTSQTQDDIYKKQITVSSSPGDPDTKLVTSTVTWTNGFRPLTVKLVTLVTNSESGAFCSPTLSSAANWKNPSMYTLDTTDLVGLAIGNNSNGLGVSQVAVYRGKMYLAASTTPAADHANNTLYIFSLPSNPNLSPTFLGFTPTTGDDLAAVAVAQKGSSIYAYVLTGKAFNFSSPSCTNTSCPQFQVVNVTNPASPSLLSSAGRKMPVTGTSGQGVGKSIYYSAGYVYVGLAKAAGASDTEFNIIDVGGGSGSPTNPVRVGGYHVGFTVDNIYVKGTYAYLATTDNASGNKQLLVLDISNKTNPQAVGYFSAPGMGVGYATQVVGTKAYFGRAFSGATTPNFYVLDASNPASALPVLGSKVAGTNDSVNALTVRDFLAFLVTNKQFQIWDISNPASMTPWSTDGTTGTFVNLTDIDSKINGSSSSSCSGDFLYLALQTSTGSDRDVIAIVGPHVTNAYSLSNSGDIIVTQGSSGSVSVTAGVVSGYPGSVSFTASGLPGNTTASFSPASCTPGCSSAATLTVGTFAPAGTYPITITGTGGVTTSFKLTIGSLPFDYSITNSGNITLTQGSSGSTNLTLKLLSGTTQPVTLSVAGLPAGATATFGNNGCSPDCSSSLSVATQVSTPTGTYPLTVTGSNGKSTALNLVVNPQPFDYALTAAPNSVTLTRGGASKTVTVTVARTAGTSQSVNVSLSNLPSKVTATALPASASCTPNSTCSIVFTLSAANGATKGTVTLTATGTSPTHTTTFDLTVN